MKILLTGASGYIGLHLVNELLNKGHQVTAIARSKEKFGSFLENENLVIERLDLTDSKWYEEILSGHDCCIHLALIWGNYKQELEGYDSSITANFFEAAGVVGIKRAIYTSSTAVHRSSEGNISEDHKFTTKELYGATKAAGELFFRAACERHNVTGIVVRPGPVVGKPFYEDGYIRSPHMIENFRDLATKNQPITIRENAKTQFCDIHVLAKTIEILSGISEPKDTYFCVGEEAYLWKDLASYIAKRFHPNSKIIEDPINQTPIVYFITDRLKSLLGELPDTKGTIYEHIDYLIKKTKKSDN